MNEITISFTPCEYRRIANAVEHAANVLRGSETPDYMNIVWLEKLVRIMDGEEEETC